MPKFLRQAEEAGLDFGNAWHVVALSFPGAVVYGGLNALLEKHVFRRLGFAAAGLVDGPGAPFVLDVKFPVWMSACLAHSVMWSMWWKFTAENDASWVLDHKQWSEACVCRMEDKKEQRAVGPYYSIYFSYVLHSCYKDILKTSGRKGGPLGMMLDLHHLLTVVLVGSSIQYGTWRGGVLTRLIHDITDIVLYACKLRQAMHETRPNSSITMMRVWFTALLATWAGTRLGLYGYLCHRLAKTQKLIHEKLKSEDKDQSTFPYTVQFYGSVLMLGLQVVFFGGICDAWRSFEKTGGKQIADPFHGASHS